ncbi:MAG: exodeoxyribonuclease VII large subunit, partial [Alphaproteobacteria bacterium]|nr:exodeoxyribonuclease VII large subunit [Alphaproteobacteria bacterium]
MSEAKAPQPNLPEFTVSELTRALRDAVEDRFGAVRVRGEISGFKRAASGHLYFRLKDADAVLDAVCWRGTAAKLRFKPEDGLEVLATGRLTVYGGRSTYQIVVESLEPAGAGALMALLEQRRKALAAEGLFDAARKRPLPFLPEVIGVITSPTGAVIRDILHRLRERFPRRVLIWPVAVQGDKAAAEVAAAVAGFNALKPGGAVPRPDLLIVARGGGSLEDLWPFNEEIVVRAVFASTIPVISAVGHETDVTLIDHVADRRAPTPTAAAEMAVPVRIELLDDLGQRGSRLAAALRRLVGEWSGRLAGLVRGLRHPRQVLELKAQRLDDLSERLRLAAGTAL